MNRVSVAAVCFLIIFAPGFTEASTPSQTSASLIDVGALSLKDGYNWSAIADIKSIGTSPLLGSIISSGTPQINVSPASKTKKFKDSKSGVSMHYPAKPAYVVEKKSIGDLEASHGYMFEVAFKGGDIKTGLGLVSHGTFGLIGWDSLMYGAKTSLYDIKQSNKLKLPPELFPQLKEKKEYVNIGQYKVEHNYIEYGGRRVMGMYSAINEVNGIMIGGVMIYADASLISSKNNKRELMSEQEAKEMLVTLISKSTVDSKRSKTYFQLK